MFVVRCHSIKFRQQYETTFFVCIKFIRPKIKIHCFRGSSCFMNFTHVSHTFYYKYIPVSAIKKRYFCLYQFSLSPSSFSGINILLSYFTKQFAYGNRLLSHILVLGSTTSLLSVSFDSIQKLSRL